MIVAFVDIENKRTFLPESDKFIFWCPGSNGQSIGIIYNFKIIPLFSENSTITISIEENDYFALIDPSLVSDDVSLDTCQCYSYEVETESIGSYYGTVIYITAYSESAVGEFTIPINIDGNEYIIGADFYGSDERLYINLLNFGIDISEQITKAIWPTDVYEHNIDYTIYNRKFKELLSNYWDVIANKGNYLSLENSLKWFEWGNNTILREIWKTSSNILEDWELNKILTSELENLIYTFSKTTYISIITYLYTITSEEECYNDDLNPILEEISYEWTVEELRIKMALLRSFFSHYFMPIHLDLLYASLENWCFASTKKINSAPGIYQVDIVNTDGDIEISASSTIYITGNIQVQANSETLFCDLSSGSKGNYEDTIVVGVSSSNVGTDTGTADDEETKIFMTHFYSGPGTVATFNTTVRGECTSIIKELIIISGSEFPDGEISRSSNIKYSNSDGDIEIEFEILFKEPGTKIVQLQFLGNDSRLYTGKVEIEVIDMRDEFIKVYKVVNGTNGDLSLGDEMFSVLNTLNQDSSDSDDIIENDWAIPGWTEGDEEYIYFYHFIVCTSEYTSDNYELVQTRTIEESNNNYVIYYAYVATEPFTKDSNIDDCIISRWILRYDKISLEEISGTTLDDYNLVYNDIVYVKVPDILVYQKDLDYIQWIFTNMSTSESRIITPSTIGSFISIDENYLSKGYYTITLQWSVSNTIYSSTRNSAFRINY